MTRVDDQVGKLFWISSMTEPGKSSNSSEVNVGARIKITDAAGPRLASKRGTVLGYGRYSDAKRVKLDDSKSPITLHKKYLSLEEEPG
jgi:hypothetical protein